MAHLMKHTKVACGHLFQHYDRSCQQIGNENINSINTKFNYNLAEHQSLSQNDFLKKRLSEVYCQNRKDINVMCSWVVTAPKDLPKKKKKNFLKRVIIFSLTAMGKTM